MDSCFSCKGNPCLTEKHQARPEKLELRQKEGQDNCGQGGICEESQVSFWGGGPQRSPVMGRSQAETPSVPAEHALIPELGEKLGSKGRGKLGRQCHPCSMPIL